VAKHYTSERAYLNRLYRDIKRRCLRRKYDLKLTFEEFKKIIFKNCIYCGAKPEIRSRHENRVVQLATNSVDRVDSSIGYTKPNCVPCCITCNFMKQSYSKKDFIEQCGKIFTYYNSRAKK